MDETLQVSTIRPGQGELGHPVFGGTPAAALPNVRFWDNFHSD
jgi:hypothetical protein